MHIRPFRLKKLHAALLALPLTAAGFAAWPGHPAPQAAVEPAPVVGFAQPQMADVIAQAQPAVVKIAVSKRASKIAQFDDNEQQFDADSPLGEFLRRFGPGAFGNGPRGGGNGHVHGLGSGFIIDAQGYIVTNNHVIEDAEDIKVSLADGREFKGRLLGADPQTDLALVKIDADGTLPAVAFGDSDHARVGEWVVAIGAPFGLGGTATAGIISARGRDIHSGPYDDFLQIDAPINSGNSGGPVLGADGRVLGVNTAIYSPNGGSIGIGFAIPARVAERVVGELRAHGSVTRGWLGVQIQPVTNDMATALGLHDAGGALVAAVTPKSPAARAGLEPGDVVVRFGTTPIKDARDLSRAVALVQPGSKVDIAVFRHGDTRTLSTVVDRNTDANLAAAEAASGGNGEAAAKGVMQDEDLGLALAPLSRSARDQLNLDDSAHGALVVGIKDGGPAERGGLKPGDLIIQVDRAAIADATGARDALAAAKAGEHPAVVLIRRGDQQFFTTLHIG